MATETLTSSLQESVLAVLAFDQKYGGLVAAQVVPENFDGPYHEIATAVLAYRRRYNKPPGRAHLENLFARAKLDPSDVKTRTLRRTLTTLATIAEAINAEYIATEVQSFVREQKLKSALVAANERFLQGGDGFVVETEGILHDALRFRQNTLDAGIFLSEVTESSVFRPKDDNVIGLNIPQLDRFQIGPTPKRHLLYIAPKNTGKTWFCIHVGRQSLLQKARVCHITLEMSEHDVIDRYYQSFFGIASRSDEYAAARLDFDDLGRLAGFRVRRNKPKLDFGDPRIRKILRSKVQHWGARFNRLVIKEFPSGTLSVRELRGYLDYLETVEKFIPNVLIVDYPDLFKIDTRDYRLALGRIFVDLRGLAGERNYALVTPTQSGRDSMGASQVRSRNVTEDISKVFTADDVLTYSQTEAEAQRGLARITVEHARFAPKGMQVLITQAYSVGQFIMQSATLQNAYWEALKEASGEGVEDA